MNKILIVDDNKDISEMIKLLLSKRNMEVCINNTGLHVCKDVDDHNPDLILLDIGLPGRPGTEICKELKEKYSIPVILVSALNKNEDTLAECGADGFIQKPFHINDLVATVNFHLISLPS